ncbi:MAG: triple tyrosine motif-containing protein [Rheinheimera sp.]|nr:triple tyrosine motif-containing protein [Rheinheimera sp.]
MVRSMLMTAFARSLSAMLWLSILFAIFCYAGEVAILASAQANPEQSVASVPRSLTELSGEFALPPITQYLPKEYKAHRQNWDILQAPSGMIYVANTQGILEFDGLRWRLIKIPNFSTGRTLDLDKSTGRIYVGSINEFGYLESGQTGALQYQSLLPKVPPEHRQFGNVWQTTVTPDAVFFTTSQRLFRVNHQGVTSWAAQHAFLRSIWFNGKFYLRDEGVGLLVLEDEQLQLAPDGHRFAEHSVRGMLPLSDSNKLLIMTNTLGFWLYDGKTNIHWPTSIDEKLKSEKANVALLLPNGQLAIGMSSSGIYLLDSAGQIAGQVDHDLGLPDNSVYGLALDTEQGLWLGTQGGLARLQMGTARGQFDQRHGLEGSVLAVKRAAGKLFVGTSQGLFWLEQGVKPHFNKVSGIDAEVYVIDVVQQQLLIGTSVGVYRLNHTTAQLVYRDKGAKCFLLLPAISPQHPATLLVGTLDGIAVLLRDGDSWRFSTKIIDHSGWISSIHQSSPQTLWIRNRDSGLYRLNYPSGQVLQGDMTVNKFGVAEGLPDLKTNYVTTIAGQIRFLTSEGIYQLDDHLQRMVKDPGFASLDHDARDLWSVIDSPEGLWLEKPSLESNSTTYKLAVMQPDGRYQVKLSQQLADTTVDSRFRDDSGLLWAGGSKLFQLRPALLAGEQKPFHVLLRSVQSADGSVLKQDAALLSLPRLMLDYTQNKLRFEFAAASYEGSVAYAVWLEGVDKGWTDWSHEAFANYNSLREGDYVLKVKARSYAGAEAQMTPFPLRIAPPWFRTYWAYAAYLLCVLALINRWHHWRSSRLRAEALLLNQLVDQRTADLSKAKTEVEHTLTSLKSTQRQLVRAEKMAALGQLVAGVAHEVNTPLGVALTGNSLLRDSTAALASQLDSGQREKTGGIWRTFCKPRAKAPELVRRNLQRAAELISNFKQVSVDRSSGRRRIFNLRDFLDEVEQSFGDVMAEVIAVPAGDRQTPTTSSKITQVAPLATDRPY